MMTDNWEVLLKMIVGRKTPKTESEKPWLCTEDGRLYVFSRDKWRCATCAVEKDLHGARCYEKEDEEGFKQLTKLMNEH